MPISPIVMFGGLGALAFLFLKKGEKGWSDEEYSEITEYRNTPQGPARYFKAEFVPSIAAALAQYQIEKADSTNVGGKPLTVYTLTPGSTVGPTNALSVAQSAYQSGLAVFVTVNIWSKWQTSVALMTADVVARASFAKKGLPWAILADPQYPLPTNQTPPGTVPGVTPPGTVPGTIPGTPPGGQPGTITLPGGIVVNIPPGVVIPGVTPPSGTPPTPPGGTPPVSTPPSPPPPTSTDCVRQMDVNMPEQEKTLACAHMGNPSASVESLILAAKACEVRGYPKAAALYYATAKSRGWTGEIPGIAPPPTTVGDWPFRIRTGDIPYILAGYYTGDSSRVKEILTVNPGMAPKTIDGATYYQPWVVGSIINLPASWPVGSKPLPIPATKQPSGTPYVRPT